MKQGDILKDQLFERYFMANIETVNAVVIEQVDEFRLLVDIGDERHKVDFSIDGIMRSKGVIEGDNVKEWQSTVIPVYRCGNRDNQEDRTMEQWSRSDTKGAEYVGTVEFQDNRQEWHNFEILRTEDRLVFGGYCNVGFLESGFMRLDKYLSFDDHLQELVADLETFYNDGKQYTSYIVCNNRM